MKKEIIKQKNLTTGEKEKRTYPQVFDVKLREFSSFLQAKIELLSGRSKIIIFCWFIIVGCAYNCYNLVRIFKMDSKSQFPKIKGIVISSLQKNTSGDTNTPYVSDEDIKSIVKLRFSLDSLKVSPEGRKKYALFIQSHPRFLDSIRHVETSYYSQMVKK